MKEETTTKSISNEDIKQLISSEEYKKLYEKLYENINNSRAEYQKSHEINLPELKRHGHIKKSSLILLLRKLNINDIDQLNKELEKYEELILEVNKDSLEKNPTVFKTEEPLLPIHLYIMIKGMIKFGKVDGFHEIFGNEFNKEYRENLLVTIFLWREKKWKI